MKKYDKILFVSHSDTCRGPMAEAILQNKVLLEDILVDSKGMIVLLPEPVNQKAEAVLVRNGLTMENHESVQFTRDDFDQRTLILTMEETQRDKIREEHKEAAVNLYSLGEYSRTSGNIYNPIGKDLPEYGQCFDELEQAISQLVNVLKEEEESC